MRPVVQPFDTSDPLSARLRFRLRTLTNVLIVLGIFIPSIVILALFITAWLADLIVIAAMFYLYFFILDKRAIGMHCNHCHKVVKSNTPWICGFCEARNQHTDDFPFVHRCEHCGAEPKSYQCHHCQQLIFLNEDQLKANPAICIGMVVKVDPPPLLPDEATLQKREVDALQHQLIVTRLASELNREKRNAEFSTKKSPEEVVEESLAKHLAEDMAGARAARRIKLALAEELKDDPEMLKKANASVEMWLEGH